MKEARVRPQKKREVGVRPERLAVIREPEFFKRSKTMREFEALLRQKADTSRHKFEQSTNAVDVTKKISLTVRRVAEAAVAEANSAESNEEKLAKINSALITVVQICEEAAVRTKSAVDRHVAEISMLQDILSSLEPPEETAEDTENPEESIVEEESELVSEDEPKEQKEVNEQDID